jgi:pyridoxine 5-phosphate synthase
MDKPMPHPLRLGVNIDHVATLRNARGGAHPDPLRAALLAAEAGADSITLHLREDRRHIRDADVEKLRQVILLPINLEMAATEEMLAIALHICPHAACIVPERRQEVTTEGGLNVAAAVDQLKMYVALLSEAGIRTSLFIDPRIEQVDAAHMAGAPVVEFNTARYSESSGGEQIEELEMLKEAVEYATELGMECHAGHGLSMDNVAQVAAIPQIVELNIGHFLVGEAIFCGLKEAIKRMRTIMDHARKST